ncbi:MAG: MGH1-like glycoside hydrolase domain-containing protein, partial [Planctomycetota bacterium]
DLLDDFVHDYKKWEKEKLLDNGLLWQHDVWDGMEESISGSRKHKNARPPLNSYMYANAKAISKIARLAGKADIAREYSDKAAKLKSLVQDLLWDDDAQFFKVRHEDGKLADVREEIGLIPWYFNLPDSGRKKAWLQILDPEGFLAPKGLMTAERRHPDFRSHGVGTCEWDGAVWPYATAQSLVGLANVLRNYEQSYVSKQNYFNTLVTYARSHRRKGKPYIGEYLDEVTGQWLTRDSDRSRYYNHSAFCDLVITGLVGLVPRDDNTVEVHPLSPADSWEWFCLDSVLYHSRIITILWDQTGDKYGKGKGLRIYADGKEIAHSDTLERVTGSLAK